MEPNTGKALRVAIIGAGPAGIATAHELLEQGFDNFTIFEKADAGGGTWHLHSYPGLACDLWAHSYTFSYRPNPQWSANFVDQPEIEAYLQQCIREFGLEPHLRLNTKVTSATYQADSTWELKSETGEIFVADVIVNAMGGQHTPIYPSVDGLDLFEGDAWHSTHWNHSVSLKDKRVVVVGSAAAAVQIVPKVAAEAAHLTVLQRTPNWIMERNFKPYSARMKRLFARFPIFLRAFRYGQGLMMGVVLEGVTLKHKRMEQFEARVYKFIDTAISDPELRKAVTPTSRYGCKRGLVSDEFYPTLTQTHVELVAEGLAEVQRDGIVTASGRTVPADVLIYCTGYKVMDFDRIAVQGRDGALLAEEMALAPVAYKGIAAPKFPNYFFAAGPNGLAINVSYFANVERNAKTIVNLLREKEMAGLRAIEVKCDIADGYNQLLASQFEKYSWGSSDCNSYYRTATGHAPFLFPGGFKQYEALHEQTTLQDFEIT